jgi:hypothetical protein
VTSRAALNPKQLVLPAAVLAHEILAVPRVAGRHERLFGSDIVEEFGTAYRPCCKGEEVEQ